MNNFLPEVGTWINRLVSTGMTREAATVFVFEAAIAPPEIANGILGMMYGARAVGCLQIPEPESVSVKIPRRVVWYEPGSGAHGELGTIAGLEYRGCWPVKWDDGTKNRCAPPSQNGRHGYVELRLTKTEQARLLLEELSREAWKEREGLVLGDPNCYIINLAGEAKSTPHERCDPYAIRFPDEDSVSHARDTIIRAGLAWWREI